MRVLGEGLDNTVYETNGGLILRCAKQPDPEALLREARILAAVAAVSPLPVPKPAFVSPERGWLAYSKLQGVPLIDARPSKVDGIVADLHAFLAVLHRTRIDFAEPDEVPLQEWLDEAADNYKSVTAHVPAAHHRPIATFLDTAPPSDAFEPVFCHNDLGIEHILVAGDSVTGISVTGVIDWSDAALTDPARDYGLLYRDLGPAALPPAVLRDRAVFYARCSVFEDLAFGLSTGRRAYIDKSLSSLRWLFPVEAGRPRSATTRP